MEKLRKQAFIGIESFWRWLMVIIGLCVIGTFEPCVILAQAETNSAQVITAFEPFNQELNVVEGTEIQQVPLPDALAAVLKDGRHTMIPVTWTDDGGYDKQTPGRYVFTADIGAFIYGQPRPTVIVRVKELKNRISGVVWKARVEDSATKESVLADQEIELVNTEDFSVVATTRTDQEGNYCFTKIAPGEYTVRPKESPDWLISKVGLTERNKLLATDEPSKFAGTVGKLAITEDSQFTDLDMVLRKAEIPQSQYWLNIQNLLPIPAPGVTFEDNVLTFHADAKDYVYRLSGIVSGESTVRIVVDENVQARIILDGIQITENSATAEIASLFEIKAGATVNLYLDSNTQNLFDISNISQMNRENPHLKGVFLVRGRLIVDGEGTLSIKGGAINTIYGMAAGINTSQGVFELNGGKVKIETSLGAAVGGAGDRTLSHYPTLNAEDGGRVIINGGQLTAYSCKGAGIGGGAGHSLATGEGKAGNGGYVEINGGVVDAWSQSGAGIGGGNAKCHNILGDRTHGGNGGTVVITGGHVRARSESLSPTNIKSYGAGIGGGGGENINQKVQTDGGAGATLRISGGSVLAEADFGSGIGGGYQYNAVTNAYEPLKSGSNIFLSGSIEARRGQGGGEIHINSDSITNGVFGNKPLYCVETSVQTLPGNPVPEAQVSIPELPELNYTYTAKTNSSGVAYSWIPMGNWLFQAQEASHGYGQTKKVILSHQNNQVLIILGAKTMLSLASGGELLFKQQSTDTPEILKVTVENLISNPEGIKGLQWFRVNATSETMYNEANFLTGYTAAAPKNRGVVGGLMQEEPGGSDSMRRYRMPIGENGTYWVRVHYQDANKQEFYQVQAITVDNIYGQAYGTYTGIKAGDTSHVFYDKEPIPDEQIKNKVGIAYDLDGITALSTTVDGIHTEPGTTSTFKLKAKHFSPEWLPLQEEQEVAVQSLDLGDTVFEYRMSQTLVKVAISNQVMGKYADLSKLFTYQITVKDRNGEPCAGLEIPYTGDTLPGSGASPPFSSELTLDEAGQASFSLRHGQKITLEELAGDATIQIVQSLEEHYQPSYCQNDTENPIQGTDTGSIPLAETDHYFAFLNQYDVVVVTGIADQSPLLWLAGCLLGLGGTILGMGRVVRKREIS